MQAVDSHDAICCS